jgi:hypothetical protein
MLNLKVCFRVAALCLAIGLFAGVRSADAAEPLVVDTDRGELRLTGRIQQNLKRPVHGRWAKKSTAFVGVRGGSEEKDFVVLLDANRGDIYRAALDQLGWKTGRRYNWYQTFTRRGISRRTKIEDYMTGDPILCALEFERDGERIRMPLEDAIRSRIQVDGAWVEVPYTPHFVFTGAGEENSINSGCLVCPSDCVGALMTDNAMPVQTEVQEFLIDWDKLPEAGAPVTVILRSFR